MEAVIKYIEGLRQARKQQYKNLTMFPLLAAKNGEPAYLILEEALDREMVRVTETSQQGHVPELRLMNSGQYAVLVIEGEELTGAKQNRIVNTTFMVAPKSEVVIPVTCVEQGRWRYSAPTFGSGGKMTFASLRRNHQREVSKNLESGIGYRSDQGAVWYSIAEKAQRMKVNSQTSAMTDLFESRQGSLDEFTEKFKPVECQVGAIFAINGKLVGLDAFGHNSTFTQFFPKLVSSYALDALDWQSEEESQPVSAGKARRFLETIAGCRMENYPAIAMGSNERLDSKSVFGAAFRLEDQLLHLSAFSKDDAGSKSRIGYERFTRRRRMMD